MNFLFKKRDKILMWVLCAFITADCEIYPLLDVLMRAGFLLKEFSAEKRYCDSVQDLYA